MYPIVFIVVSMGAMPDDLMQSAVDRIIASRGFAGSERLRNFLRYITEETIAGRGELLKESQIGIHVYGRQPDYDPKIDAIVRVEAGRLRAKLE